LKWRWRRSIRLPLGGRANLSGSGVGWSWGVPGARWGVTAHGRRYRALSIPGTGLYNRTYSRGTTGSLWPGKGRWLAILLVAWALWSALTR